MVFLSKLAPTLLSAFVFFFDLAGAASPCAGASSSSRSLPRPVARSAIACALSVKMLDGHSADSGGRLKAVQRGMHNLNGGYGPDFRVRAECVSLFRDVG